MNKPKPKSNDLPKSLHTITAIVRVARLIFDTAAKANDPITKAGAVEEAVAALGYATASDPHGLAAKALAQLSA